MAVGFLVPSLAIFWGRAGHNIRSARFSTSQHKNSCKKIVTTGAVAEVFKGSEGRPSSDFEVV